jgi:hypothetical protein
MPLGYACGAVVQAVIGFDKVSLFGVELTANILEGKDIATLFELCRWPECSFVRIISIRADRIGSPQQENRIASIRLGIVGNIDRREQCSACDSLSLG